MTVPLVEVVQLMFSAIGVFISAWNLIDANKDNAANRRARINGATGLAARIRIRREALRLSVHSIFVMAGLVVVAWRLRNPDWPLLTVSITRNASILVATFLLVLDTWLDRSDRRIVGEMVDEEQRRARLRNRRATDTAGERSGDSPHVTLSSDSLRS